VTAAQIILVIGGARSGKSRYAEALAAQSGRAVTYVATAGPPRDSEMADRIARHQADRPADWTTVEVTHDLPRVIGEVEGVTLVDCLTLWLSNIVLSDGAVDAAIDGLIAALGRRKGAVVAVTNEVGEGIVPATALGRSFRDQQGMLNQRFARAADTVVKMVAGCPLLVKPSPAPEIRL
jgi:adenosylcobinamide kinase/adenosylcobinamide-phosphate guanylyltransferase